MKEGSGFILQFGGNLLAGSGIIPGDLNIQNKNAWDKSREKENFKMER